MSAGVTRPRPASDALPGARVVVIGGAGFIGSHVVDQLIECPVDRVVVLDNFSRGRRENLRESSKDARVEIIEGDIAHTDVLRAAVQGADCVFHLAALWLLHCQEYPRAAFDVNIAGTYNVLEACRDAGVKHIIYSSSASVYGEGMTAPMTEESPLLNRTFYGATKIAGEQMGVALAARYGFSFVGLRYMNVYGPRQPEHGEFSSVIIRMLERLDAGEPIVIHGDGLQTLDFVHVRDAARANVCAALTDGADGIYNVGSGVGTTILDLAKDLQALMATQQPMDFQPAREGAVLHRVADIARASAVLGFESTTPLHEGLCDMVAWWRGRTRGGGESDAGR